MGNHENGHEVVLSVLCALLAAVFCALLWLGFIFNFTNYSKIDNEQKNTKQSCAFAQVVQCQCLCECGGGNKIVDITNVKETIIKETVIKEVVIDGEDDDVNIIKVNYHPNIHNKVDNKVNNHDKGKNK